MDRFSYWGPQLSQKNMFVSSAKRISPRPLTHYKDHLYREERAGGLVKRPEALPFYFARL